MKKTMQLGRSRIRNYFGGGKETQTRKIKKKSADELLKNHRGELGAGLNWPKRHEIPLGTAGVGKRKLAIKEGGSGCLCDGILQKTWEGFDCVEESGDDTTRFPQGQQKRKENTVGKVTWTGEGDGIGGGVVVSFGKSGITTKWYRERKRGGQ